MNIWLRHVVVNVEIAVIGIGILGRIWQYRWPRSNRKQIIHFRRGSGRTKCGGFRWIRRDCWSRKQPVHCRRDCGISCGRQCCCVISIFIHFRAIHVGFIGIFREKIVEIPLAGAVSGRSFACIKNLNDLNIISPWMLFLILAINHMRRVHDTQRREKH